MKTFLALLLAALCAATSYGQTMKALSYNASNGVVAYSGTNTLNFPNAFTVAGEVSVTTSGISGFGGTLSFEEALFNANGGDSDWALGGSGFTEAGVIVFLNTTNAAITRTNLGLGATWLTNGNVTNFRSAIGLGTTNTVTFSDVNVGGTLNVTNKGETRTNLGLPLPALTNTSNVTVMRALAGSTNTNQPYSGAVELSDGIVSWLLTFSNGILLKLDEI